MTDMGERKPHSEMHKRQRSKNLALMAVLIKTAVKHTAGVRFFIGRFLS